MHRRSTRKPLVTLLALAIGLIGIARELEAQSNWTGADDGNWFDTGNWSAGIPGPLTIANIPGGTRAANINTNTAFAGVLNIGSGGGFVGRLNLNSGRLVTGAITVGTLFGGTFGEFNIGNGGAPPSLLAGPILVNIGGEININHNGNLTIISPILGPGILNHEGLGTTRLAGPGGNIIADVLVSDGELVFVGNRTIQATGVLTVGDRGTVTLEQGLDFGGDVAVFDGGVLDNSGTLRTFLSVLVANATLINRSGGTIRGNSLFGGSGPSGIEVEQALVINERGAQILSDNTILYAIEGEDLVLGNAGTIIGPTAIRLDGTNIIVNDRTGTITGTSGPSIMTTGGISLIQNAGSLIGRNAISLAGDAIIQNAVTGRIQGSNGVAIRSTRGSTTLENMGRINGNVELSNTGMNTVTLYPGSSINGNLGLGSNPASSLTLPGMGTNLYSQAVTGSTTGNARLFKTGTGTWIVDRNLGITGDAFIQQGELRVLQTLASRNLLVNPSTTLSGNGTVLGNVINNGVVNPGSSPGILRIGGDFVMGSGGMLVIEIGSLNEFDQLEVGGRASLNGRVAVSLLNGYLPDEGDEFSIIRAEQGVEGRFTEIDDPAGVDFGISYEENEVVLVVLVDDGTDIIGITEPTESIFVPFKEFAETPNEYQVACALDEVRFTATGDLGRIINELSFLPGDEIRTALAEISPQLVSSYVPITFTLNNTHAAQVQQRLSIVRDGSCGWQSSGLVEHSSWRTERPVPPDDGRRADQLPTRGHRGACGDS